ncbi:hypothetical protein H2203_007044 [Taxawa tesnikishii (nom. ined.)]|nr:hypothetical protein H2203_007044 [Dothideales sp. JES 119]
MAGGKKKKTKPAANPARGFATTSIASKPKPEKTNDASTDASETASIATAPTSVTSEDRIASSPSKDKSRELHELSPEELEQQLETSELQNVIDQQGPKVRKESARQVARLQTDRRVFRGQADNLTVRDWLPEELMLQILDLIEEEEHLGTPFHNDKPTTAKSIPEDDLLSKIWQLYLTFSDLGISQQRVNEAIKYILAHPPQEESGNLSWGLTEALDWLPLHSASGELLDYDATPRPKPGSTDGPSREPEMPEEASPDATSSANPQKKQEEARNSTEINQSSDDDIEVSDLESDLDPDEMLSKYLQIKTRLYQRNSDLIESDGGSGTQATEQCSKASPKASRGETKLLQRLKIIESDVLFDQQAADHKWSEQRLDIIRDQSERKKLQISEETEKPQSNGNSNVAIEETRADDVMKEAEEMANLLLRESNADGDSGFLSGMFDAPAEPGSDGASEILTDTVGVTKRNFGKLPGMSARRILEEACRARDPVSRSTTIMMTKIATPDVAQSEGYVSTAALFLLFSTSPKEEKAALRLPPAFRDLWQEFVNAKKERTDTTDRETVKSLRTLIREQVEREEDEDVVLTASFRNRSKDLWARKTSTPAYQQMLVGRMNLPMYQFRDVALAAVEHNQVTILCGETGCGKSTQMPAFILEHELSRGRHCKVYCTEPRRISAISLAQRVSEELGEGRGSVGTARSLVGYAIRLESQTVAQTRLVYATVGIVLRMLESAKELDGITHLVIDEIHERSIDTDFLLIVLKSLMTRRPDLKVVLMSATVDADRFSRYLDNAPIVTVPGRTFPVQAKFLEDAIELTGYSPENDSNNAQRNDDDDEADDDMAQQTSSTTQQHLVGYSPKTVKTLASYDEYRVDYGLILRLLEKVAYHQLYSNYSKAILVFLPGIAEIRQLNEMLTGHPSFSQGWLVYPLHSSFSSEEQQAAFNIPPPGVRKIVLATNIAETGVTIPDVTCVIDTGKHKEMRFDERRQLSRLIQSFISRANAKQRRGRAGRVQEGICFHLFTKYRHDEIMAEQQTPEMLRLSLQDLVMRVKICNLGDIEQALSAALDPPSLKNIRRAIDALVEVNALTSREELTPLGLQLAKLPLDAQLGKLILLGSTYGCVDFALTTAAILSSKSPFLAPMNAKKQADSVRLGFKRGDSDLLTAYNAYLAWRRVCTTPGSSEFQFCKKNFLSPQNLANIEDLKSQLLSSLADAGFVSLEAGERAALSRVRQSGRNRTFVSVPSGQNFADNNDLLINSVTAWSFYPKVLARDGKGWRNIANNQAVSLHPSSVNKGASLDARFLSFYSIMQSSSRFTNAQETSPVSDFALVLLAGDAVFNMYAGVIIVDGNRLRFKVRDWRTMIVLKTLRAKARDVLARSLKNPGREPSERQKKWMEVFYKLFERNADGARR